MPLSDVVNVVVVVQNPGVTAAGFGVGLVTSFSAAWVERTRTYSGAVAVLGDFAANTPEYLAAAKYFGQSPSPSSMMIGRCALKPTQKFSIGVVVAAVGGVYAARIAAQSGSAWASQTVSHTALASAAWVALTAYATGDLAANDAGKLYVCITAGTSAGAGGPTGTAADITDGTVHWMYAGAGGAGVASNDAIVYNLKKLVDALAAPAVSGGGAAQFTSSLQGVAGSKTLQFLANTAGNFYGVEVSDLKTLSQAQTQADPGIATDLAAIALESNAWYGLITTFNSSAIVAAAAAWVETVKKLYPVALQDSLVATQADGVGSDIAQTLKAASYARTAGFFHPANDEFADAAEMGRFFPISPGGDNWRLKALAGVTVKKYTDTQTTNMNAKYVNFYYTLAPGANVIGGMGKVFANQFIDVIRGIDWWAARVAERIANKLIQLEKIPYTDEGVAIIETEVKAQNSEGIAAGLIAKSPAPVVTVPKVADVNPGDKAARTLNNVNTNWTLAGAIDKVQVNAQVSA